MPSYLNTGFAAFGLFFAAVSPDAVSETEKSEEAGLRVFQATCAGCHTTGPGPRQEALKKIPINQVLRELTSGRMCVQGMFMSRADREAVAAYVGAPAEGSNVAVSAATAASSAASAASASN